MRIPGEKAEVRMEPLLWHLQPLHQQSWYPIRLAAAEESPHI